MGELSEAVLALDAERECARIARELRTIVRDRLRRRGVVVAVSGGVDSAVCAGLAVQALGRGRVLALLLPEPESDPDSLVRGKAVCQALGVDYRVQPIGQVLEALDCYGQRDEAMRRVFPDYGPGWRSKLAIAGGRTGRVNYFELIVRAPDGETRRRRLRLPEYLEIVAASNYKQRVRKIIEYFHADRRHFAVVGSANRLELDQGFFVKNGDGAADVKPIAHLYKTQVYALARHLALPAAVLEAEPTTDTYSLPQGQDEFYFALPYPRMDLALWAYNHHVPAAELARALNVDEARARWLYRDIEAKRRATEYLHRQSFMISAVPEVASVDPSPV